MKLENLTEDESLDLELLVRTVKIEEVFGAGDAVMIFRDTDNNEKIGKLIKRAMLYAEGAPIAVRKNR